MSGEDGEDEVLVELPVRSVQFLYTSKCDARAVYLKPDLHLRLSPPSWKKSALCLSCLLLIFVWVSGLLSNRAPIFRKVLAHHAARSTSSQDPGILTTSSGSLLSTSTTDSSQSSSTVAVQEVFQVSTPVAQPQGNIYDDSSDNISNSSAARTSQGCQVMLMNFTFANSFGKPFVGNNSAFRHPKCYFSYASFRRL